MRTLIRLVVRVLALAVIIAVIVAFVESRKQSQPPIVDKQRPTETPPATPSAPIQQSAQTPPIAASTVVQSLADQIAACRASLTLAVKNLRVAEDAADAALKSDSEFQAASEERQTAGDQAQDLADRPAADADRIAANKNLIDATVALSDLRRVAYNASSDVTSARALVARDLDRLNKLLTEQKAAPAPAPAALADALPKAPTAGISSYQDFASSGSGGGVYVHGYTTKSGTYVSPHYRSR